jgi:hypothetical protein
MKIIAYIFGLFRYSSYVSSVIREIDMTLVTPKELKNQIESFNNAYVTHVEGGWMYFRATDFAAKGIRRELGKKVQGLLQNEYRILMSNNQ